MRSFLLLLLLVCRQYRSAGAQIDSTALRYIISTQPAQYLFGDYSLRAERFFRRQSLGLLLGYKPATRSEGHVSDFPFLAYMDMNMFNKIYNAATLGLMHVLSKALFV